MHSRLGQRNPEVPDRAGLTSGPGRPKRALMTMDRAFQVLEMGQRVAEIGPHAGIVRIVSDGIAIAPKRVEMPPHRGEHHATCIQEVRVRGILGKSAALYRFRFAESGWHRATRTRAERRRGTDENFLLVPGIGEPIHHWFRRAQSTHAKVGDSRLHSRIGRNLCRGCRIKPGCFLNRSPSPERVGTLDCRASDHRR